jgi:chloride channel 3/4/5
VYQVKDSYRLRDIHSKKNIRGKAFALFDASSGWIAAAVIGALTACVAYLVDIAAATVSDWKLGHCTTNPFLTREACCSSQISSDEPPQTFCAEFIHWREGFTAEFGVYVAFALAFGIVSAGVTMLTKCALPSAGSNPDSEDEKQEVGKTMYMAAGSGIPEIKTILGGFVIPDFLSVKVLVVKAVGAVFAVSTGEQQCPSGLRLFANVKFFCIGMCLGKEGPFVHISTCVGYLVASLFPKYRDNGRKMREMLSAACAAGLSVAFGAPIGGVLFSYEEISTYFPRKVLWRAFLCSAVAAMVLKELNPTGTGKLVLFETNYGTSYSAVHYLVFVVLGKQPL